MTLPRRASLVFALLLLAGCGDPPWTLIKETELVGRDGRVIDVTRERVEGKLDRTACALVQSQHEGRQREAEAFLRSFDRQAGRVRGRRPRARICLVTL
jgi:hypothetical protein